MLQNPQLLLHNSSKHNLTVSTYTFVNKACLYNSKEIVEKFLAFKCCWYMLSVVKMLSSASKAAINVARQEEIAK